MPKRLTLEDATKLPWLLQCLDQDECRYFSNNKVFHHEGRKYQFKYPILARKRKDPSRGYAYEEIDPKVLGEGFYSHVYPIRHTLSRDKDGNFRIRDHRRVVKIMRNGMGTYYAPRYPEHIRAKEPSEGHMVMGRIEGKTLRHFLSTSEPLAIHQKLKLTKALMHALKEQVSDMGLVHNDLSPRNIMIAVVQDEYKINIIDFDESRDLADPASMNRDLHRIMTTLTTEGFWSLPPLQYPPELQDLIRILQVTPDAPLHISLDQLIQKLDSIVFTIEDETKLKHLHVITQQIQSLKSLSEVFLEEDSDEKKAFKLLIDQLEAGTKSGTDSDLGSCAKACDAYLKDHSKNLKFYMRKRDIFYEIAVILACLIVLYPLAMAINYRVNNKITFFGENKVKTTLESLQSQLNHKP